MSIYVFLVGLLVLLGLKPRWKGFDPDYISRDNTMPIKGIFILLIFASHFMSGIPRSSAMWDGFYSFFRAFSGQLVVSMFLFYSGFGVAESIRKKGVAYVKIIPVRRVLKILIQFDIATILCLVLQYVLGKTYSPLYILKALVGWERVGIDNWYVFAILYLYLATWLSFCCFGTEKLTIGGVAVLTFFYAWFCVGAKGDQTYFYNTAFTYLAGMLYSRYKPQIEKVVFSSNKAYWLSVTLTLICFRIAHQYWGDLVCYELTSVFFALLVVFLTAKFTITNPILRYAGEHLFSLYLLHRLPMIALRSTAIAENSWLYFSAAVLISFVLSFIFDETIPPLWSRICQEPAAKEK